MMPAWGEVKRDTFQLSDTIFHGDKISVDAQDFFTTSFCIYEPMCFFFFLLFMFWKR